MKKAKKKIARKKIYIRKNNILFVFLFVVSFLTAFIFARQEDKYEVILSQDGFSPKSITIPEGAEVTWIIEGEGSYWPASDIHPLHNSYPDGGGCLGSKLDACRPMKKGEKYSFKFDREGKWGMHDHLNPQLLMTVSVKGNGQSFSNYKNEKTHKALFSANQRKTIDKIEPKMDDDEAAYSAEKICSNLAGSKFREKQHCYTEVFYFIAKKSDPLVAFSTLEALQRIDPKARICHLIAHGIGWAMYDKNPEGWQDAIGKMSPECSYGGIHGIIEQFSAVTGRALGDEELRTVCDKNPNWACYHAIGHVILVQEKNNLSDAASLCSIYNERMSKMSCLNGVFMEHMIGQNLAEHGFVTFERRKFFYEHLEEFEKLCLSQSGDNARACWTEIIHAAAARYKGSAREIYAVCDKAQTKEAAMSCRRHAVAEILPMEQFEPMNAKEACLITMKNDPTFEEDCYLMLASVAMSNAPDKIESVIGFCSSLNSEYQKGCFERIESAIALLKSKAPTKASSVCQRVPEATSVCNGSLRVQYDTFSEQ
jgi:hypothetical protein